MSRRGHGDDDIIDRTSLFEIATRVYCFSQWRNKEGFHSKKSEYIKLRNELIEQLKIEYPQMTDAEIFKFFNIYLGFNEDPHSKCDKSDFFFNSKNEVSRIYWVGPYLQKSGDWKYWWLVENMGLTIHHP